MPATFGVLADRFAANSRKRIRPAFMKYIGEWRTSNCQSPHPDKRPSPSMAPNWHGPTQPCHIHGALCTKCHACAACRPEQRAPAGDWDDWLYLGGRGTGKTRACAEEVAAALVLNRRWRIAILAPTYADARDTCVEGESGLLAIFERWGLVEDRDYTWNRSIGELIMVGTKSRAKLFTAEKPARMRGPQHHMAWVEELAQVVKAASDALDMLRFGLRLGKHPRLVASTTPLPLVVIKDMLADPQCAKSRGTTDDNAANLPRRTLEAFHKRYDGTRLGRQELGGDLLDDMPGALWKREWLDGARVLVGGISANWGDTNPETIERTAAETREAARAILSALELQGIVLSRIVVGVDPAVTSTEDADESGIVVAGIGTNGEFYVLADYTVRDTPEMVVSKVLQAYDDWDASTVIVEVNNGGEWIPSSIHTARKNANQPTISCEAIRAKKGKRVRAEPVSVTYEGGHAHHVGTHKHLEDQLCIARGELVNTRRGWVPIEQVTTLDQAWTRSGWRAVTWSGATGRRETIRLVTERGEVVCTPDHPVWVEGRGWTNAEEVQPGYKLLSCLTPSSDPGKSSTAPGTTSTTAATTGPAGRVAPGSCTVTSGRPSTATSPTAGTSTTAITTRETTGPRTFTPARPLNTSSTTSRAASEPGIDLNGRRQPGKPGPRDSHGRESATAAVTPSSPPASAPSTAPSAVSVLRIEPAGERDVYDLTVQEAHEFYAGGLLVHNCVWTTDEKESPDRMDAVVYCLLYLAGHGHGSDLLTAKSTIQRHSFAGRSQMSTTSAYSRR